MTAFLVTATIIQTRHLVRRIFHRRREPRHCSGEMFTTRQVFNGFLDLLASLLPSAPRYVARPTAKAVAACSATVGACLFTSFLKVFRIALRVFFFKHCHDSFLP